LGRDHVDIVWQRRKELKLRVAKEDEHLVMEVKATISPIDTEIGHSRLTVQISLGLWGRASPPLRSSELFLNTCAIVIKSLIYFIEVAETH